MIYKSLKFPDKKAYIAVIALILGIFLVFEVRAFGKVENLAGRDKESDIFQEIKILNEKNANLQKEITELDINLKQLEDQNLALSAIEDEIIKTKKLSGRSPIFGPGISVTISGQITTPWTVDMVNELFASGAEAVSVNEIRIVENSAGLDTLPQGQILLNGSILAAPYTFNAIGEPSILIGILEQAGGIIDRLRGSSPGLIVTVTKKEVIQMD